MNAKSIHLFLLPKEYILGAVGFNCLVLLLYSLGMSGHIVNLPLFLFLAFTAFFSVYSKKTHRLLFIVLLAMGIPSDLYRFMVSVLVMIVLGMMALKQQTLLAKEARLTQKLFFLLTGYLALLFVVFQGIYSDLWSFPLYIVTFLSMPLAMIFMQSLPLRVSQVDVMGKSMITVMFAHMITVLLAPLFFIQTKTYLTGVATVVDLLYNFNINIPYMKGYNGDIHTSTLSSSTNVGNMSLFLFIFLLVLYLLSINKRYFWVLAGVFYVYLMTDTKHAHLGVAVAFIVIFYVLQKYLKRNGLKWLFYGPLIALILVVVINFGLVSERLGFLSHTFFFQRWNPKQILFNRCGEFMLENPLAGLVGHGPGTFGSRVASARATDILYKEEIKIPAFIPPFYNEDYQLAMRGLYTYHYTAGTKSGAMMNPFASIVGIIMEMGVIGSAIFFYILFVAFKTGITLFGKDPSVFWKAFGLMVSFSVVLLPINSLFLQYFEHPALMSFFWGSIGLVLLRQSTRARLSRKTSRKTERLIPS